MPHRRPLSGRLFGRAVARILFSIAALLLGVSGPLHAQTGTVTGTVVRENGAPLSDASLHLVGLARTALSDAEGRFVLTDVPVGSHTLVVDRLGHATTRTDIEVTEGVMPPLRITLAERALDVVGILVTADRAARRLDQVAASVGVVGRRAIEETQPTHPSELMGQVPGVWVNVTGGEGHMTSIRQPLTTDPVYLFLEDGVPTRSTGFFNHNALYEVNVPQADRVEVVKGPANALYGSDAIGGVVNSVTRAPAADADQELTLEGGAYGYARALASISRRFGSDGVRLNANYTRTDGWRDGTAYDRLALDLRWDRTFANGVAMKTVVSWSTIDQKTAGTSAISLDDYRHDPTANYTPISYRAVGAFRVSSALEGRVGDWQLSATPYGRVNTMDMLPNWALTFDPAIWESSHSSLGLLAKAGRDLPFGEGRLVVGIDLERSPGDRLERAIDPVREGAVFTDYSEGQLLYDYDVTFRQASPYLHTEFSLTERVRLTAGLRYDALGYDYETAIAPTQDGRHRVPADARRSFRAWTPKFGVTVQASDEITLFGAARRGFRAPSEGQLFRQGVADNTLDLEPVKATSLEAGVRGRVADRLTWEASVYRMTKVDDILSFQHDDGTTETQNAGETLHRGVELGLALALAQGLRLEGAWTFARHRYESWTPSGDLDFAGQQMEHAPKRMGNVRLTHDGDALGGLRVTAEWVHLGPYFIDPANQHEHAGHDLLNLRAAMDIHDGLGLFVRLNNVADTRYAERVSYNAFRGAEFAPGMPRTLYFGLRVR